MKRFISTLLTAAMLLSLLSIQVSAVGNTETITRNDITMTISGYLYKETKVIQRVAYGYEENETEDATTTVYVLPATGASITIINNTDDLYSPYSYGFPCTDGAYDYANNHRTVVFFDDSQIEKGKPISIPLEKSGKDGKHDYFQVFALGAYGPSALLTFGSLLGTETTPFKDVSKEDYFHDAVIWALKNNVTTGTSASTFSPAATCTRGQVVTFLWRAKGCPEPVSTVNPFDDVKESDYFYKAVLWAVENGITTGATPTSFSPAGTCTNAHVVTFLHRSEGRPAANGESAQAKNYSENAYYKDAVAWADTNGLLSGTGSEFTPANYSPRANIVTYLYRNAE